jgi:hypothetical protein
MLCYPTPSDLQKKIAGLIAREKTLVVVFSGVREIF